MQLVLGPLIMEVIRIPAGPFLMGCDGVDEDTYDDEKPMHEVYLPQYFIGKYPVTVSQYALFLAWVRFDLQPAIPKGRRRLPATGVNWHDAREFCQWAGRVTGQIVRLPTEAEWEKAARGTDGRLWPWGNTTVRKLPARAALPNCPPSRVTVVPVGSYSPSGDSPYGCADMSGNVWEWTHSLYRPYPYHADDGREKEGNYGMRVLRGGSFRSRYTRARCTSRLRQSPENRFDTDLGFRVCVTA
jgi:formylglycine-generating enzyme required for sulfatase activity